MPEMPFGGNLVTTETPSETRNRPPLQFKSRAKGKKPIGAILMRSLAAASEAIMAPAESIEGSAFTYEKDETSLLAESVNILKVDLSPPKNSREALPRSEVPILCKEREDAALDEQDRSVGGREGDVIKHGATQTMSMRPRKPNCREKTKEQVKVRMHRDKVE